MSGEFRAPIDYAEIESKRQHMMDQLAYRFGGPDEPLTFKGSAKVDPWGEEDDEPEVAVTTEDNNPETDEGSETGMDAELPENLEALLSERTWLEKRMAMVQQQIDAIQKDRYVSSSWSNYATRGFITGLNLPQFGKVKINEVCTAAPRYSDLFQLIVENKLKDVRLVSEMTAHVIAKHFYSHLKGLVNREGKISKERSGGSS